MTGSVNDLGLLILLNISIVLFGKPAAQRHTWCLDSTGKPYTIKSCNWRHHLDILLQAGCSATSWSTRTCRGVRRPPWGRTYTGCGLL